MPYRLRIALLVCLSAICWLLTTCSASIGEEVWSGLTHSFTHDAFTTDADQLTPNVAFNRGATGGLFNSATESGYLTDYSPEFTLWATEINNPEDTEISLDNRHDLNFTDWRTAYGGQSVLASNILEVKAIVFLELDEIYLELQFQTWAQGNGSGGGFSYLRSAPAMTMPTGDYNGNLIVDAADYTLWRDTLGSTIDLRANGDNTGDSAGIIDLADYAFWKAHFGNPAGSASAMSVVPEPASLLLLLGGWLIIATARRIPPRGPGQNF